MEQWNNVELSELRKKSYTLNHDFNLGQKSQNYNNNESTPATAAAAANADDGVAVGASVLQPGSDIQPKVHLDDVEALVRRLYGITTSEIKPMISYDDVNYFVQEDRNIKNPIIPVYWPHGYVLKILNALDSKKTDFVDAQNQAMIYLSKHEIKCPRPIQNVNGKYFSVEHINGKEHVVRLLEFVPGKIFHEAEKTNYLLFQSGEYLAKIDRALKKFTHKAYDTHKTLWMMQCINQLKDFFYVLQDHSRKSLVEEIIEAFITTVLPKLDTLESQIIHGDYNEQNVLVEQRSTGSNQSEYRVAGIIDFGDTSKSPIICEIGVALTYMLLEANTLESGGIFLAGYNSVLPISSDEKPLLKYCVLARLAQSLVMGLYTHTLHPENEYVLATQEKGWKLLEEIWRNNFDTIDELWQTTADNYLTQSVK